MSAYLLANNYFNDFFQKYIIKLTIQVPIDVQPYKDSIVVKSSKLQTCIISRLTIVRIKAIKFLIYMFNRKGIINLTNVLSRNFTSFTSASVITLSNMTHNKLLIIEKFKKKIGSSFGIDAHININERKFTP